MTGRSAHHTLADYAVTLAPWLGYVAVSLLLNSWRFGFAAGLAASLAVVLVRLRRRDVRFIDLGTLGYCTVMTALSVADPKSPIAPYNMPMSLAAFGCLSLVSLAIKCPFTYRIARDKVAAWILDDPGHHSRLRHAHTVATASWAGAQIAAGVCGMAFIATRHPDTAIAAELAGTLTPAGVTKFQHERFLRSAGNAPADESPRAETADDGAHYSSETASASR